MAAGPDPSAVLRWRRVALPWNGYVREPKSNRLKIAYTVGPEPIAEVQVAEDEHHPRVVVTLFIRVLRGVDANGVHHATAAFATDEALEVLLADLLGDRTVYDGATAHIARQIDPDSEQARDISRRCPRWL